MELSRSSELTVGAALYNVFTELVGEGEPCIETRVQLSGNVVYTTRQDISSLRPIFQHSKEVFRRLEEQHANTETLIQQGPFPPDRSASSPHGDSALPTAGLTSTQDDANSIRLETAIALMGFDSDEAEAEFTAMSQDPELREAGELAEVCRLSKERVSLDVDQTIDSGARAMAEGRVHDAVRSFKACLSQQPQNRAFQLLVLVPTTQSTPRRDSYLKEILGGDDSLLGQGEKVARALLMVAQAVESGLPADSSGANLSDGPQRQAPLPAPPEVSSTDWNVMDTGAPPAETPTELGTPVATPAALPTREERLAPTPLPPIPTESDVVPKIADPELAPVNLDAIPAELAETFSQSSAPIDVEPLEVEAEIPFSQPSAPEISVASVSPMEAADFVQNEHVELSVASDPSDPSEMFTDPSPDWLTTNADPPQSTSEPLSPTLAAGQGALNDYVSPEPITTLDVIPTVEFEPQLPSPQEAGEPLDIVTAIQPSNRPAASSRGSGGEAVFERTMALDEESLPDPPATETPEASGGFQWFPDAPAAPGVENIAEARTEVLEIARLDGPMELQNTSAPPPDTDLGEQMAMDPSSVVEPHAPQEAISLIEDDATVIQEIRTSTLMEDPSVAPDLNAHIEVPAQDTPNALGEPDVQMVEEIRPGQVGESPPQVAGLKMPTESTLPQMKLTAEQVAALAAQPENPSGPEAQVMSESELGPNEPTPPPEQPEMSPRTDGAMPVQSPPSPESPRPTPRPTASGARPALRPRAQPTSSGFPVAPVLKAAGAAIVALGILGGGGWWWLSQGDAGEASLRQANRLFASGDFAGAAQAYGAIIQTEGPSAEALSGRGRARIAAAQAEEGLRDLEQAFDLDPNLPELAQDIGDAHYSRDDYEKALSFYEVAQRSGIPSVQSRFRLATSLVQLDRGDEALPHLEAAVQSDPNHGEARFLFGNLLNQARQFQRAEEQLRAAAPHIDQGADYLAYLGVALLEQGKLDETEETARRFIDSARDDPRARALLGEVYLRRRQYEPARRELIEALRINPTEPRAQIALGLTWLEIGKRRGDANDLGKARRVLTDAEGVHEGARLLALGKLAIAEGALEDAKRLLLRSLDRQASELSVRLALAEAKARSSDLQGAAEEFERASALAPDDSAIVLSLAVVYAQLSESSRAAEHFVKTFRDLGIANGTPEDGGNEESGPIVLPALYIDLPARFDINRAIRDTHRTLLEQQEDNPLGIELRDLSDGARFVFDST